MNLFQSPSNRPPPKIQNERYSISQSREDLGHAISMVKSYDPAAYLAGRLLPTPQMEWTYYGVRSFWVETGLRIGSTALVSKAASPQEQLHWWEEGIEKVFRNGDGAIEHPTLRLLHHLKALPHSTSAVDNADSAPLFLSKCHFDDILKGRREDLSIKQYATLDQLEEHAMWSCGSLSQLILEADGIFEKEHPLPHQAVKLLGRAHGLTNALRLSIPVVSTTGKLVIPQDLCEKYGVKSPRYLLSALGQGDEKCTRALQLTVEEIVSRARGYLKEARELRPQLLALDQQPENRRNDVGKHTVAVLLPALTSETFLDRLEAHNFDLTNRNLRNVNMLEHTKCATNLLLASLQQTY
ncbi:phytoene synthase [Nitzschia inconspicua]|uniref:Phytoene synthase n=1 Tax=Nitzschia inconspicua TaxID=303405 RepID=A0A9K3Q605_9STRA|nr:phytoene synthase [Nitzschia inconspicua]